MLNLVLVHPQIPANTGNVIRMCANSGTRLHLVEPLGFRFESALLRRARLDYHEFAEVQIHESWSACRSSLRPHRMFGFSAEGDQRHDQIEFSESDVVVFGCERSGFGPELRDEFRSEGRLLRLPMMPGSRSLNLANAAAIVVYEAWRQQGFRGEAGPRQGERTGSEGPADQVTQSEFPNSLAEGLGDPPCDV